MRSILVALVAVTVVATAPLRAQETENGYVRNYKITSVIAISGSLVSGAWSYERPNPYAHFASFTFAAVDYALFLTGIRSESVPRSLSVANLAAGGVAGILGLLGMQKEKREKEARRRGQQSGLHLAPAVSASGGIGFTARMRF